MDYSFSNGFAYSTTDLNPLSAIFPYAGVYGVDLTVTSIYGCIYTSQIPNIIEVTPLPIAGFTISKTLLHGLKQLFRQMMSLSVIFQVMFGLVTALPILQVMVIMHLYLTQRELLGTMK